MLVSDFMNDDVVFLSQDQTVLDAAKLMMDKNISAIPIVDDEHHLVGIFTESDFTGKDAHIPHAMISLKRLLGQILYPQGTEEIYRKAKDLPLKDVMSTNPRSVELDYTLDDVVTVMNTYNLKRIPVVQGGKLMGIVTRHEIIKAFTMIQSNQGQELNP